MSKIKCPISTLKSYPLICLSVTCTCTCKWSWSSWHWNISFDIQVINIRTYPRKQLFHEKCLTNIILPTDLSPYNMALMSESLTCDHPKEILPLLLSVQKTSKIQKLTDVNSSPSPELNVWPHSEKSCYPHLQDARDIRQAGSISPKTTTDFPCSTYKSQQHSSTTGLHRRQLRIRTISYWQLLTIHQKKFSNLTRGREGGSN